MTAPWTFGQWAALENRVRSSRGAAYAVTCRTARQVLHAYSSSFFLVTRFLPAAKRTNVELIYAAVRYPDEIVDTFPLTDTSRHALLDQWERDFHHALTLADIPSRLAAELPWILAAFAEVVREHRIPAEHYVAFLDAMRRDIEPTPFTTLPDLIDRYIYGSAIVVGYFLAHVYGAAPGHTLDETYTASANLGIALQLTNFCRDVEEDRARGRSYIPSELVGDHGLAPAIRTLAEDADARYAEAARTLHVFSPDTRAAIRACIDVYGMLNRRILNAGGEVRIRHSVPVTAKLSALPPSKYWRIPLAYMGAL
jgi:phytoene synthase